MSKKGTRKSRKVEEKKKADQPPPPALPEDTKAPSWKPGLPKKPPRRHPVPEMSEKFGETEETIYNQLLEIRKSVSELLQEAKETKLRKRLELVPVRISDLMQGLQAAMAKANRAVRTSAEEGEDIERMAIKDLQVTLSAPIIEGGHAVDPTVMLPNIKSVTTDTATVTLSFNVVSVPLRLRG